MTQEGTTTVSVAGRADFASRIQARAVVFGAIVMMAAHGVFMSLGAGFGLWSGGVLDVGAGREPSTGFFLWAAGSWIVSALAGGFFAAAAARPTILREGLLNSVAAWATAWIATTILMTVGWMAAVRVGIVDPDAIGAMMSRTAFWTFAGADILAFASALVGGWLGCLSELEGAKPAPVRAPERPVVATAEPSAQPG